MPREREFAVECKRTLDQFGRCDKTQHDAIICPRCHTAVHPVHTGMSDYHADLESNYGLPFPIIVECKANLRKFEFSQITQEQHQYLADWMVDTGGQGYIWLQLGEDKVGTIKTFFPRSVWMIPYNDFLNALYTIEHRGGVKYIPMNEFAVVGSRIKDKTLTAHVLFFDYQMEWLGDKKWRPNRNHPLYKYTKVQYKDLLND